MSLYSPLLTTSYCHDWYLFRHFEQSSNDHCMSLCTGQSSQQRSVIMTDIYSTIVDSPGTIIVRVSVLYSPLNNVMLPWLISTPLLWTVQERSLYESLYCTVHSTTFYCHDWYIFRHCWQSRNDHCTSLCTIQSSQQRSVVMTDIYSAIVGSPVTIIVRVSVLFTVLSTTSYCQDWYLFRHCWQSSNDHCTISVLYTVLSTTSYCQDWYIFRHFFIPPLRIVQEQSGGSVYRPFNNGRKPLHY
jgi:hypothetical protein